MKERGRFSGLLQIVRFNWPQYAGALLVITAAISLNVVTDLAFFSRVITNVTLVLTTWWTLASLAASYYIYDLSPLMMWKYLPSLLPREPVTWANIHSGLDESTPALGKLFGAGGVTIEIFDDEVMTEGSIQRARGTAGGVRGMYSALPLRDDSMDAVFLLLSAHELRRATAREKLFADVSRVLTANGRVILVEHLRDAVNAIAFGPGCLHFLPAQEWDRVAHLARLKTETRRRMTPFVQVLVLRRD